MLICCRIFGQDRDTIKVIISISDTSVHSSVSTNYKMVICGDTTKPFPCDYKHDTSYHYDSNIYWVFAYEIREKHNTSEGIIDPMIYANANYVDYWQHITFLDLNKNPFPSNIIIWQQK